MSHIPYGYKVVEGKAVVNTEEAEKVKKLYLLYIELRQYVPAARKAGIDKDVNLNTFRHSFAVHLLQKGANVRAVQKLLGNQVLTYMDTYYEIINNDKITYIYNHTHPRA